MHLWNWHKWKILFKVTISQTKLRRNTMLKKGEVPCQLFQFWPTEGCKPEQNCASVKSMVILTSKSKLLELVIWPTYLLRAMFLSSSNKMVERDYLNPHHLGFSLRKVSCIHGADKQLLWPAVAWPQQQHHPLLLLKWSNETCQRLCPRKKGDTSLKIYWRLLICNKCLLEPYVCSDRSPGPFFFLVTFHE